MKPTLLLTFFLTFTIAFSQTDQFNSKIESISQSLQKVQTSKTEYIQKIATDEPGVVKLQIDEVTLKNGKTESFLYEFNLADIDVNTVRAITLKDVISVQLLANKKQNLIKRTINGEKISYEREFNLYATDIDNGRVLEKLFQEAIPIAEAITNARLDLKGYADHLQWLTDNVGDVNLPGKQFVQSIAAVEPYPGKVELKKIENAGKKTISEGYVFNAGTINPNSLMFSIKGDEFGVSMETSRKIDNIKYYRDNQQGNYTNELRIVFENIEKARDFQKVMKEFITLSHEKFEKTLPTTSSVSAGFQTLNGLVAQITVNDATTTQEFTGNCVATLTQRYVDAKKSTIKEYVFNFKDANENNIPYRSKGQDLFVTVGINGGNDYIKFTEEGEQKNFTEEFDLYVPGVEEALITIQVLKDVIKLCQQEKEPFDGVSKSGKLAKLTENLEKVSINDQTFDQTFEISEDGKSIIYKKIEISPKSSVEYIYEFNLKDIDPNSVKIETSRKNVRTVANTYFQEKIIKSYKDGNIGNYENRLEIEANDIENARKLKILLSGVAGKD